MEREFYTPPILIPFLTFVCVDKLLFTQFMVSYFNYHFMRQVMASVRHIIFPIITYEDRWVCIIYLLL